MKAATARLWLIEVSLAVCLQNVTPPQPPTPPPKKNPPHNIPLFCIKFISFKIFECFDFFFLSFLLVLIKKNPNHFVYINIYIYLFSHHEFSVSAFELGLSSDNL